MILPVILSGGSGTRLWPLSRELYPKQLLALTGRHTLLQQTALRVRDVEGATAPLVICNEEHRFMVAEQLREIGVKPAAIILEPLGRNTAPAVAVAALWAKAAGQADAQLLVLPADHLIAHEEIFRDAVRESVAHAGKGKLVTFGIVPHTPETGYGYIRQGKSMSPGKKTKNSLACFAIAEFVEKPDLATAQKYVDSGQYHWNSGMFMLGAGHYLKELEQFSPDMVRASEGAFSKAVHDLDFYRLDRETFAACPSDSIDYAVMEKTKNGAVIPIDPGWNDIGAWSALWDVGVKDQAGNVLKGDVLAEETTDSYLYATGRMIATVGVKDLVVVETADAVLVASRGRVQEVKRIVNRLKAERRQEANLHRRVVRPWGAYESLSVGERYQVKRITVNPGAVLSLQLHHHRAEHWVVVRGTARITRGEESFIISEDESTYISLGQKHRLENPGVIPLELIEVQSGPYLGEDDIVRFSDNYGRAGE